MINQASPLVTQREVVVTATAQCDLSSSLLAADWEQYELMQTAYKTVGLGLEDKEELIGSEYSKLLTLEWVPGDGPLRGFIPL